MHGRCWRKTPNVHGVFHIRKPDRWKRGLTGADASASFAIAAADPEC
jgi:hypothetical protein